MALTRVSPSLFATSNNITSVTVGGSANTISLTFDGSGVITSATNNAVSVANTAITGNIISSQITSVANTQISGNITAAQITSVANTQLTGLIEAAQIGSANATLVTSGTLPKARLPTGSVLQVVSATSTTTTSTTGGTFIDTGLSATITPTSATSKIFILVTECFYVSSGGADTGGAARIVRDSTAIFGETNTNAIYINATGVTAGTALLAYMAMNYLDSPATTSATTYKTQFKAEVDGTIVAQGNNNQSSITLMEIAA